MRSNVDYSPQIENPEERAIRERLTHCFKSVTQQHHWVKKEVEHNDVGVKTIDFRYPRCLYCKMVNDYEMPDMQNK